MKKTFIALAAGGSVAIAIAIERSPASADGRLRAVGEMTQQASPPPITPADSRPAVVPAEPTGGLRAGAPPGSRAGGIGLPAIAEEPAPASEAEFLKMTGNSTGSQLRLAELAAGRTEDPQVKKLADSLVTDYTASNEAFTRLTKALRFKAVYLTASQDLVYSRIHALNGTEFDRAFLHAVQQAQSRDCRRFEAATAFAGTKALTLYLQKTSPLLHRSAERVEQFIASSGDAPENPVRGLMPNRVASAAVEER